MFGLEIKRINSILFGLFQLIITLTFWQPIITPSINDYRLTPLFPRVINIKFLLCSLNLRQSRSLAARHLPPCAWPGGTWIIWDSGSLWLIMVEIFLFLVFSCSNTNDINIEVKILWNFVRFYQHLIFYRLRLMN